MTKLNRREFTGTLAIAGAGLAVSGLTKINNVGAEEQITPVLAHRGKHQPRPLRFNPARLTGLSEKLIQSHWQNNYGGSVRALNAVENRLNSLLREKDLPAYIYGDLKREELLRTGSVILHEYYFDNLGGDGKAGEDILAAIGQWFGSFENWEVEFKKTATSLSGGSGWAILAYNLYNDEIHNYWAWDHMHHIPAGQPLLVLDMYEHSYHMDYGAAAAKYIDAFLANTDWEEVNHRYLKARKAASIMREAG